MKNIILLLLLTTTSVWADFINGTFSTNNLTPWTRYTTTNGIATAFVSDFGTTTAGVPSASGTFLVGSSQTDRAGGGIQQSLTLGPGSYTVSADIAVRYLVVVGETIDRGLFQLFANDVELTSFDFGVIVGQVFEGMPPRPAGTPVGFAAVRRTITANLNVPTLDENVNFKFQFRRGGVNTTEVTHYIDNVSITESNTGSGIPEPSTMVLMASSAGAIWLWRRKRN